MKEDIILASLLYEGETSINFPMITTGVVPLHAVTPAVRSMLQPWGLATCVQCGEGAEHEKKYISRT